MINMENYTGPSIMDLAIQHSNYTNPPMGNFKDQADEYLNYTVGNKFAQGIVSNTTREPKQSDYCITKIRPRAEINHCYGNDGRDSYDTILYRCPTCNRIIGSYREETACDKCGTFYDWGKEPARIVITKSVQWD